MSKLTTSNAWLSLQAHQSDMSQQNLYELFAQDSKRFERFSLKFNDILMDYSKHPVSQSTINLLLELARQQELENKISDLFCGKKVNFSEDRAALHFALRREEALILDGVDIMPEIHKVLAKMDRFISSIRNGERKG